MVAPKTDGVMEIDLMKLNIQLNDKKLPFSGGCFKGEEKGNEK